MADGCNSEATPDTMADNLEPPVSSVVVSGSAGVLSSPPASPVREASAEAEFEVDADF